MSFNGEKLLNDAVLACNNSCYRKAIELLKNSKQCYPNEYRLWMIETINKLKNPFNSEVLSDIKDIPFEKLVAIADDELNLPLKKRLNAYIELVSISPKEAIELFEKDIYPNIRDSKNITNFIYQYCNALKRTSKVSLTKVKEIIYNAEDIINNKGLDIQIQAQYFEQLIDTLYKLGLYDEAFDMLNKYKNF